jgi:hypothetical protein
MISTGKKIEIERKCIINIKKTESFCRTDYSSNSVKTLQVDNA